MSEVWNSLEICHSAFSNKQTWEWGNGVNQGFSSTKLDAWRGNYVHSQRLLWAPQELTMWERKAISTLKMQPAFSWTVGAKQNPKTPVIPPSSLPGTPVEAPWTVVTAIPWERPSTAQPSQLWPSVFRRTMTPLMAGADRTWDPTSGGSWASPPGL